MEQDNVRNETSLAADLGKTFAASFAATAGMLAGLFVVGLVADRRNKNKTETDTK